MAEKLNNKKMAELWGCKELKDYSQDELMAELSRLKDLKEEVAKKEYPTKTIDEDIEYVRTFIN